MKLLIKSTLNNELWSILSLTKAAQFVNPKLCQTDLEQIKREILNQLPVKAKGCGDKVSFTSSPELRRPMIIGMCLVIGQQVTGLPAMYEQSNILSRVNINLVFISPGYITASIFSRMSQKGETDLSSSTMHIKK